MVHQPRLYLHCQRAPPLPLSLLTLPCWQRCLCQCPQTFLTYQCPPAMYLWAEDVDISIDVARQAILYVHANFASELSQRPSADCTCLSEPLQALMVKAVRAVTGDASFHLLSSSDAQSDSSAAAPATDSAATDSPSSPTTSAPTAETAPRRSSRQRKTASEYWKVPPAAPGGAQ